MEYGRNLKSAERQGRTLQAELTRLAFGVEQSTAACRPSCAWHVYGNQNPVWPRHAGSVQYQ